MYHTDELIKIDLWEGGYEHVNWIQLSQNKKFLWQLTHLFTAWSNVFVGKLIVAELVKKFPVLQSPKVQEHCSIPWS
jgi:hypothetical protein